MFMMTA